MQTKIVMESNVSEGLRPVLVFTVASKICLQSHLKRYLKSAQLQAKLCLIERSVIGQGRGRGGTILKTKIKNNLRN